MAAVPVGPPENPIDALVRKLEPSVKLIGWIKAFMGGGVALTIAITCYYFKQESRFSGIESRVATVETDIATIKAQNKPDHDSLIRIEENVTWIKKNLGAVSDGLERTNRLLMEHNK